MQKVISTLFLLSIWANAFTQKTKKFLFGVNAGIQSNSLIQIDGPITRQGTGLSATVYTNYIVTSRLNILGGISVQNINRKDFILAGKQQLLLPSLFLGIREYIVKNRVSVFTDVQFHYATSTGKLTNNSSTTNLFDNSIFAKNRSFGAIEIGVMFNNGLYIKSGYQREIFTRALHTNSLYYEESFKIATIGYTINQKIATKGRW